MAYQGELWVWGRNTHGQLGLNSNDDKCNVPRHLPQLTRVKTVSCGREHTGIVTANGELFTFGDGAYGKLGHGDSMELFAPKKIDMLGLLVIKSVACANEHTLALTDTGDVYSWGYNTQGRLGQSKDFLSPHVSVPRMMGRLVGAEIEAIGCAGASSYALSKKVPRTLYVWGSNQFGQLGLGTNSEFEDKPLPVTFPTDKSNTKISIQQAAIGECHLVCVSTAGSLFVWGRNDDFRLGLKHSKPVNAPVLHELSNWKVTKVACGGRSTAAITATNELFVWQYVDNDKEPSAKNPMVAGQIIIKNYDTSSESQSTSLIADVAVGGTCGGHVVCTTVGGQIWSWGKNNFGQTARPAVAHRKNTDRWTPAKVPFIAGASSLYCGGYHSVALLNSQETLFFQYVRDGNIERLKALLLKTSKFINNLSDNSTALLIACKLGLPQIVNTLISFRASALIHDENGQNPLHVCASKYSPENPAENEKFLECLGYLQNSHAIDTSLTDHNNKTPLHLAVECGNTPAASCLIKMGASLDDKDLHQMTPLQYCTNSDAFLYKSLANKNDIFVVYEPSVKQLVVDLCKGFESYYMTSVYTSTEIEVERLISGCSIVVFIVSNECVTSPFSLSQLFTAERLQKPVFSLWKDKIKLPPKVENIVFTRQLVDFSSTAKFNESLTQLCAGLRKIVYGHSTSEADLETAVVQDARDDDEEQDTIGHYAFISYDKSDKAIAETIKNHLTLLSVSCVMSRKYDNHPDAKEILSKKIVGCGVFISVLSKKSMKELAFRAELALAENHKRPILVVFPQRDITLDPSLEYTTANLPIFYVSEAWLEQLHEIICIHERIAASTEILQK